MDRDVVAEFHYIAPVANLPSIVRGGIVSHNIAARSPHSSVALEAVQDRRAGKRVPGGLLLHDYANLYFDARNPMMSLLRHSVSPATVVVRVHPGVLDLASAVIADGNAAAYYTRFYPSPEGLAFLDARSVYTRSWPHPDPIQKQENKRKRCAELLIPHRIPVELLKGAYCWNRYGRDSCEALNFPGEMNADVFFR
jgi:hypothetical protein